jgi:hypothetical protein
VQGNQGIQGIQGQQGIQGSTGSPGTAATISAGLTTTGAAGTSASVINSGTSSAAVFDFTIPQGIQGNQGIQGIQGIQGPAGPPGPAGESNTVYTVFTRGTDSLLNGFYADSYIVLGWSNTSNELNIRQPTARANVYAVNGINNGGSFPSGASMILSTVNNDYFYQPSTGSITFTISSDGDGTHPFYSINVVLSGTGGSNYIYTTVQKFTPP